MKRHIRLFFLCVIIALVLLPFHVAADNEQHHFLVNLYFFHGNGCPHCADEEVFLKEALKEFGDQLIIHDFEIWEHPENVPMLEKFAAAYTLEPQGVPVTFIGAKCWVGFSDIIKTEMREAILAGVANGVVDAQEIVDGKIKLEDAVAGAADETLPKKSRTTIKIPLLGEIDLAHQSLLVSTILIGIVDGVNPCSLWVLTMLLAMVVHTHSRKKTLIIGAVFLTVTALIYALFIAGVFTILNYVSYLRWIKIGVAAITMILGLINLKDYFFFKEGPSLTISESQKPGIYQKMRNVMNHSEDFWAMIGATILLSIGVSLVEFSCTAAFPVVWSNLLVSAHASRTTFIILLIIYMVLYQLDEMIIFGIAVATMKSSRMEEKHGQILKLFSGVLMFILSLVMIVNPDWMNELLNTLLVFLIAVAICGLIVLLTDKILPKFGIYIGHRKPTKKEKKLAARHGKK